MIREYDRDWRIERADCDEGETEVADWTNPGSVGVASEYSAKTLQRQRYLWEAVRDGGVTTALGRVNSEATAKPHLP